MNIEHLLVYIAIVVVIAPEHSISYFKGIRHPLHTTIASSLLCNLHADTLLLKLLLVLGYGCQLLIIHHHY